MRANTVSRRVVAVLIASVVLALWSEDSLAKSKSRKKVRHATARGTKAPAAPVKPAAPALRADDPCYPLDERGALLAAELESLWTRDARRLVSVVSDAAPEVTGDRLALLLAIAYTESAGDVLTVSSAGAAGLAQATPIAVLQEAAGGPVFVTADYVRGAEAYYLKKPLADAELIAGLIEEGSDRRARALLTLAFKFRREGFNELEQLTQYADTGFEGRIEARDRENVQLLERLDAMLAEPSRRGGLAAFRNDVGARYRVLRSIQRASWAQYRKDLMARRDAIILQTFGGSSFNAYEAGEVLGQSLDVRFSPRLMAEFLGRHLDTKRIEAMELGVERDELDHVSVGLYNGGTANLKRLMTGLLPDLRETQAYMLKVPRVRQRLVKRIESLDRDVAAGGD